MLSKRIIPCLDIKNGRTVKGINFLDLRDAGDPVELGSFYAKNGADELVFLDITATIENRSTFYELVRRIAEHVNIPFTVGGGISSVEDVEVLLNSGADKVSINTSAVQNPSLITDLAKQFGSQCVVVAVDTKQYSDDWYVHTHGGRERTSKNTLEWVQEIYDRGGGEILLTSMNNDGTKGGFALNITKKVSESVNIPVIASGGAGNMDHFISVFNEGSADAALAASIFHFKEIEIKKLKEYLRTNGIAVRI